MKTLDEDLTDGLEYGFPVCCVLMFVNRGGTANERQALDHGVRDRNNPHVPCGMFHMPDFFPDNAASALHLYEYNGVRYE